MNHQEVIDLLTAVSAADRRKVGKADVEIWIGVLADLRLDECLRALRAHLRTRPGVWLEPGHIRQLVFDERAERRAAAERERPALPPGVCGDGVTPVATPEHRAKCMAEIRAHLSKGQLGTMPV